MSKTVGNGPRQSSENKPQPEKQSRPQSEIAGRLLVFSAAVLWGTSGTAQELAPIGASSAGVGTARLMLCAVMLSAITVARGQLKSWKLLLQPVLLLAGIVQAVFHLTYFGGLARTGVTVGTMVAIGSCPVFAGLLGGILDKEKLSKTWMAATGLALSGLTVLLLAGRQTVQINVPGIALALTAGFSYTLFTWITRRLVRQLPVEAVLSVSFAIGSFFLIPILMNQPLGWVASPRGIQVVLYLGLISAGVAYFLYGHGLRSVRVSTVGTLTLAEPLTAAVLGIFFLGETLTNATGTGIALIFAAQLLIVVQKNRVSKTTYPV